MYYVTAGLAHDTNTQTIGLEGRSKSSTDMSIYTLLFSYHPNQLLNLLQTRKQTTEKAAGKQMLVANNIATETNDQ